MLLALRDDGPNEVDILSTQAREEDGPFYCRCCRYEVDLCTDPNTGIPYFQHDYSIASKCILRRKSDSRHRQCKLNLYVMLTQLNIPVTLEQLLGEEKTGRYADIAINTRNGYTVIEIERPSLTPKEVEETTQFYTEFAIPVLWLLLDGQTDIQNIYKPKKYEQKIAELRKGVVMFWAGGLNLVPAKLYPHFYYPTQSRYRDQNPIYYKRFFRIIYGNKFISLPSLIARQINSEVGAFWLAVEPVIIHWPVLEKPRGF